MPPPGKGDRLTAQQVGILRAWIDQGAKWGTPETFPQSAATFSPVLRWFTVEGDEKKFRELEGIKQNAGGGVEYFSLEQRDSPDKKVVVQGHFLAPEKDLALTLTLTRRDVGFVRAGFEQWRRYYDDTGGLFQSTPPLSFDLDRDLHLDVGRAWVDFGLTLPNLPQVVLGYEYDFRKGTKSTLEWGPVVQGATVENVYPADKVIDERVHVIKLDVSHELRGWRLEDNARVEFYQNNTLDRQALGYAALADPTFGGDGIVGGHLPVAAGMGYSIRLRGTDQVCLCFFGDGAVNEGAFHEALNVSALWGLPVVYIIENNRYGMGTSLDRASSVRDLYQRGSAYGIPRTDVNGMELLTVRAALSEAIDRARKEKQPTLVEVETYRYRGHSMSDPGKYRTKEEVEEMMRHDPVLLFAEILKKEHGVDAAELEAMDKDIQAQVADAVRYADQSAWPAVETMYEDVYVRSPYVHARSAEKDPAWRAARMSPVEALRCE